MSVKELIEILQKAAPTYEVRVGLGFPVREVSQDHEAQKVVIW